MLEGKNLILGAGCEADGESLYRNLCSQPDVFRYIIKPMKTNHEIDGKGYVYYKSWQEAYTGLIDASY